jgi:signal transduction histidine kinase
MTPAIPRLDHGAPIGPQGLVLLLIEDSPTDALFAREALRAASDTEFDIQTVARLSEGLDQLGRRHVDVVVLDLNLPDSTGTHTLERLRAAFPAVPLVVLSGNSDLGVASRVLQMGVQDYLVKDVNIGPTLVRSVRFAIERHRFTVLLEDQAHALQASEARLRSVIEGNLDAILIVDADGVIRFANPAARTLLEDPAVVAMGRRFDWPCAVGETHEQEVTRRDGSRMVIEPRVSPLEWEGRPALLVSLRDVTERHRALEEMEQARTRQMQIKDQFLTHISHELRTPLTVVHEFLGILADGIAGRLNEEQSEYVTIMRRNVDELNHMVEDLLEVTRAHRGKWSLEPRILDLAQVLTDTVEEFSPVAANKDIRLTREVAVGLPPVIGDPVRVVQVLDNLIGNAIKFTPNGGRITVTARALDEEVEVVVQDTGPGLEPDQAVHVFEELYQAAKVVDEGRKGLGLGLYICKQLVTRHGGRIWVESTPGAGSAFHFTLPLYSLAARLRPLWSRRDPARDHVWSLTVELRGRDGRLFSSGQELALRRTHEVLQETLQKDPCVLLPRAMRPAAHIETFRVIGCSDIACEQTVRERIRERLEQVPEVVSSGLQVELVSSVLEDACDRAHAQADEDGLAALVQRIEGGLADAA